MKKMIIRKARMAFVALAGMSISAYGSGDINVTNLATESKAKVQIEVPTQEDVSLILRDPRGRTIHYDVIEKNSDFTKVFNFDQLDDGIYTFITKASGANFIKTVEYKDKSVSVISKEMVLKPVFKMEGDILTVFYHNQKDEVLSLSLEDSGRIYYEEEGNDDSSYYRNFDLNNLRSGRYTLTFEVGDREYNYSFRR